ncbi:uncharacterized protein LOC132724911, partial [Ruditapes philippinarum]|uniref:uncharacterized protein LOC132724911 n=1 Tax=Ruditapes philippinarum TaxID=129788 RepID=UPI00295C010E
MPRKLSKGKGNKTINKSSNIQKEETRTLEKTTYVIQRTPSPSARHYLQNETWDILPKTDYTYARSGSYSPRFFGRKYVNPNMSRYRIRTKQGAGVGQVEQEDLDYDGYLSSEYSDDDRVGGELDSDSDYSIERVEVDGIELRSGKKMKTMKEILHEHDKKLQQSDIIGSMDRSSYTTSKLESMSRSRRDLFNESDNALSKSNRKALKSKTNEKQYSQSEQKRLRKSDVGHYDQSGSVVDYSNIRSRRSLNTDFATHTNLMQANNSNTHVKNRSSKAMYSNSGYDNVDDGKAGRGYSVRTVRRTTTEEFDDNGV